MRVVTAALTFAFGPARRSRPTPRSWPAAPGSSHSRATVRRPLDDKLSVRLGDHRHILGVVIRVPIATQLRDNAIRAARHRRVFAAGQQLTDSAHQAALDRLRLERYRGGRPAGEDVQQRDLPIYDRLAA